MDDNEFNLPRTHPMKDLWISSGKDKMSIQSLKHSDYVTTTTEKLYKTFHNFNENVKVFPNQFDWTLHQWNLDKDKIRKQMIPQWHNCGKIVIGWAGLTSHFEDIKRMHAILKPIHDKYPETVFVLAGMAIKDSHVEIGEENGKPVFKEKELEDKSQTYRARVNALYSDFAPDRFITFDALPLEEYAKFYTLFDISLAYIEHNAFNSCKSAIKVIESLHYENIPVFSLYGGYKDMYNIVPRDLRNDDIAIPIMAPSRWIRSIEYWIDKFKKNEHQEYISRLKYVVDDAYDINKNCEERFTWLLEKTEEFEENQINEVSKYVDYKGE